MKLNNVVFQLAVFLSSLSLQFVSYFLLSFHMFLSMSLRLRFSGLYVYLRKNETFCSQQLLVHSNCKISDFGSMLTVNQVIVMFLEGRTGVFSWCVISSLDFPWNVNLGNNSSSLVIWRSCVTREEPELLTNIRDFTIQFYVILRRKFSEWLKPSIESDLGMRFAI